MTIAVEYVKGSELKLGDVLKCWAGDFAIQRFEPYRGKYDFFDRIAYGAGSVGGKIGLPIEPDRYHEVLT